MANLCLNLNPPNLWLLLITVAGGMLPAIFWLWFWLKEDKQKPEPKRLITLVFILAGVAIVPTFFLEHLAADLMKINLDPNVLVQEVPWIIFGTLLVLALIEEVIKYLAVYLGALRSRYFDEPVDAMIYMITGALGFAAVENTFFMFSSLCNNGLIDLEFIFTGNFRFIGATVLHLVASAVVGGLIGLTFYSSKNKRRLATLVGLTGATLLHALFNYSIIISTESGQILQIFFLLWLSALVIILFFERIKNSIIKQKNNNFR